MRDPSVYPTDKFDQRAVTFDRALRKEPNMLKSVVSIALLAAGSCLSVGAASAQNQIKNAGFEDVPAGSMGNNLGGSHAPWQVTTGRANVVRIDGAGGHNYGNAGPEQDASGSASSDAPRQYFDIQGKGAVYQTFVAQCTGEIEIKGHFSNRADKGGRAALLLKRGSDPMGSNVAAPAKVAIPAGTSQTGSWKPVSITAPLTEGETYTLVASMANSLNFDEASANCPQESANKGMTWSVASVPTNPVDGVSNVGCWGTCDPRNGDTSCSKALPVLCINPLGLPKPASVQETGRWNKWTGGVIGTTPAAPAPSTLSEANALCTAEFGEGWRVAQFHDGLAGRSGWKFLAYGNVGTLFDRFWADIDDQKNGVCWDRSK